MKIPITSIRVNQRARKIDETSESFEDIVSSIDRWGQLTPITVNEAQDVGAKITHQYKLICGERRLRAMMSLGKTHIEAYILNVSSEIALDIYQLEENLCRLDFTWQERIMARSRLFYKMREADKAMTQEQFADKMNMSTGKLSQELELFDACLTFPTIMAQDKVGRAAEELRRLQIAEVAEEKLRRFKDKERIDGDDNNGITTADRQLSTITGKELVPLHGLSTTIIYDDALTFLYSLTNNSVDCICTDPPFGIDISNLREGHGAKPDVYDKDYDDSVDAWDNLIIPCIQEFARVLKSGAHLYLFFGIEMYQRISNLLVTDGFTVNKVPLIWHRTGQGSAACQPKYLPASSYQAIIHAFAPGSRRILSVQGRSNILSHNAVPHNEKTHPMEIPVSVYQDLMERSTSPGDLIIDPFCGTGNSLLAARNLECRVLGAERRKDYSTLAELKLREDKDEIQR